MKVFQIHKIKCPNNPCLHNGHDDYLVAGHHFTQVLFEQITGKSWERGSRTFRLVEVRPNRGSKRG